MTTQLTMKRGDLLPALTVTLTDDGTPVDLTGATSVRLIAVRRGTVVIDRVVSGDAEGVVTMDWQAGDTDETGDLHVEVEVTWAGKTRTFPPVGTLLVRILPDLA